MQSCDDPFQIYGQDTDDRHRPSAQKSTTADELSLHLDKQNREVFKAGRLREAIACNECVKRRCIFSYKKLDREKVVYTRI